MSKRRSFGSRCSDSKVAARAVALAFCEANRRSAFGRRCKRCKMVERRISREDKAAEKPRAKSGQRQCSETVGARQTDKRIERIRARASYRLFAEFHGFLESKPKVADILVKLYDVLDARRSFGSIKERSIRC